MINTIDSNDRIGLANKQFEAMVYGRSIICSRGTYSRGMADKLDYGLSVKY